MPQPELEVVRTIYCRIDVNTSIALMDAVAQGGYDRVDCRIGRTLFPPIPGHRQGRYTYEAQVLFFRNGAPSTQAVHRWIETHKLRSGEWPDILAYAIKSPRHRLATHIIALGSTWYDKDNACEHALCLHSTKGHDGIIRRCLDLADTNIGWTENCGFLTYRERLWKGGAT